MEGGKIPDENFVCQSGINISLFNLLSAMGQPVPSSLMEPSKYPENSGTKVDHLYRGSTVSNVVDPRSLLCLLPSEDHRLLKLRDKMQINVSGSDVSLISQEKFSASRLTNNGINSSSTVKPRGGWPKGRRRSKRPFLKEIAPRAPTTGYVIFLNEKRKIFKETHPDLPFGQVTKIIGNHWSSLSAEEKQKYLDQAEKDKKRYRDELKAYQKLNGHLPLMSRKYNIGNVTETKTKSNEPPMVTKTLEEEEMSNLYCKVCDQLFVSLHNKKEHLHGKHHLEAVAGDTCKSQTEDPGENPAKNDGACSQNKSIFAISRLIPEEDDDTNKTSSTCIPPTNMNQAIQDIISLNITREEEVDVLSERLMDAKNENAKLSEQLQQLKEQEQKLLKEQENAKDNSSLLMKQIDTLKMITTIFSK